MKKFFNVITTALFATLLLSLTVGADEGFWTNLSVAGGAYYSKVEHPDIVLEKEVLKYCGTLVSGMLGECDAHFLFKNTGQHPITVNVGVPVKIIIPLQETYADDPGHYLIKEFKVKQGSSRKLMSWKEFEQVNSIGKIAPIISNLTIIQDGRNIDIDSVLVESHLSKQDTVVIQFHFLHQLNFQPGAYSYVLVKYSAFSSTMNTGAPVTVHYIIEGLPVSCKSIGFDPVSLFDGFPESAWGEGAPGGGINEWVEFELKEDVYGLAIYNGLKKCTESFLEFEERENASKILATYMNNNRAKLIELISRDNQVKQKIQLLDTPERQVFEDIYLPRGVYKLYIRDIYKGTRWDDTCLGEIEFYLASARGIIEQDELFKKVYSGQYRAPGDAGYESRSTSEGTSGNFVIVWSGNWQEGQRSGHTIYARRFSSDGEPFGPSFKVSDEEGTDEPHYPTISATSPAVAMDGSGNFVVTWQDQRNRNLKSPGFSNEDIYAQRYASDGTPLGGNFKVNDDPGNEDDYRREFQTSPSISMARNGNFVITWEDTRNGYENKDIYAQRYASDGTVLGSNFRVNDDQGSKEQIHASISLDGSGNFVITWWDSRNGYQDDIYAQRYTSDGTALGRNFRVNDDPEDCSGHCPAVSSDGSGNFVITLSKTCFSHKHDEDGAIYAQRYSSDGTALGNNFKVSSFSQGSMISYVSPSIAADERGNFIIAWLDGRDDVIDIYAQRYASDGTASGSKFKVNDVLSIVYECSPSISIYGNDNFIIWWDDGRQFGDDARNGGYVGDIYAQRYSNDGTALGSNFRVNDKSR